MVLSGASAQSDGGQTGFFAPSTDVHHKVVYDAAKKQYVVYDKVGNITYGHPRVMSQEEYWAFRKEEAMRNYWLDKRNEKTGETAGGGLLPTLQVGGEQFDRIFGSNTIEVIPQGSADLMFGITHSSTENYTIPEDMRSNTTFDFNTKLQVNLTGRVGTKLRMDVKYNTEATFDFEQNVKVEYTGTEDEILQKVEAGNVALSLPGTLITGSQSLFGFRTDLKFGNLNVQTIVSQRKGQSQTIEVKGGAQSKRFELRVDEYEANRHFFLAKYFYDNYDRALRHLPIIQSGVEITRIEVWVTNKRGHFENSRDLVAFVDLGSVGDNIFAKAICRPNGSMAVPANEANTLYQKMTTPPYSGIRDLHEVTQLLSPLQSQNFRNGQDYEKLENARLLSPSEYTLNSKLGFISLNMSMNSDEVLAVAYEYTLNGKTYRVGEFSTDGVAAPKALLLKLLKGTDLSPHMPTWKLMMKNIYALGDHQVSPSNFMLDVLYQDDEIGTPVNYLSVGNARNQPLLSVLNLDNLNSQGDAGPDGVFDFVEGVTILAATGRLIFPEVEPFGSYLAQKIGDAAAAKPIVYPELYDSTLTAAQQVAEKNKFIIRGEYRASNSSEIPLNAPNVPKGSVVVTAGGKRLVENTDYVVDYLLGTVKIINQGILESGTPIKISLESNLGIDFQMKTLMGTHLDYRISDRFHVGGTVLNLSERPMTKKVNYGNEAMSNTIWGLNASYEEELPWLTRAIDWLPLIDTKEPSSFSFQGEFAQLIPGQSRHLDKRGAVYLDDFEANKSMIDLRMWNSWAIASTPQGQPALFPEGDLVNDLRYGTKRARLAWYTIDPLFLRNSSLTPAHIRNNPDAQSSHFVREIEEQEVFPNRNIPQGQPTTIPVLNVAYYPEERGPYNFDYTDVSADGKLLNPQERWGGMMRALPITDFERNNIEYVEFWLMDPFVEGMGGEGGEMLIHLGNVSEDILRDGRKMYENGIPVEGEPDKVEQSAWGLVPKVQSSVMAFDNDPKAREVQDVGLDGVNSAREQNFFADYLARLKGKLSPEAYSLAERDPSSDDFRYFRSSLYDENGTGILDRYKYFNNTEHNSPTAEQSPESYPTSSTTLPDVEDLNHDNTLSDNESYYQYRVQIRPKDMKVGRNCVTDMRPFTAKLANGEERPVRWFQFKVPVKEFESRVGHIRDFKSMRFIRVLLRGFKKPVVLRFATLALVRGEWRRYDRSLLDAQEALGSGGGEQTYFDLSAVNIEENSTRTPVNYVLPPEVTREIDASQAVENELNEQAMEIKVVSLKNGDARAAYRNVSYDLRQYKHLAMDVHAEEIPGDPLRNGELSVFLRLGSDYTSNYYEYEVPLTLTPAGFYSNSHEADREIVWPRANAIDIDLSILREVKLARDDARRASGGSLSPRTPYHEERDGRTVTVVGYPNLASVRILMIGVRNPNRGNVHDDGYAKSGVVWVNELRLSRMGNKGGWAALASMNAKMADFAMLSLTGRMETPGFGSLETQVNERAKETTYEYDANASVEVGRLFPKRWQVNLPLFLGFGQTYKNPEYNPLDEDVPFDEALSHLPKGAQRDSLRHIAQDFTQHKSINLTNVRIAPEGKKGDAQHLWDPQNFSVSYAYTEQNARNVKTEYRNQYSHRGSFAYTYNAKPIVFSPFQRLRFLGNRYFRIIREFNISPLPRQLSFRTDMNRTFLEQKLRNINSPMLQMRPTYAKGFDWNRTYGLNWDLMRSLRVNFTASNMALIDEPAGPVHDPNDPSVYRAWGDSVWNSVKRFGRTTQYNHHLVATYTLPINKIVGLQWISANASYNADYRWDAAPRLADTVQMNVGNTVQNSNNFQLTAQASLVSLYSKVPYLQRINQKFDRIANGQAPEKKVEYETVRYTKDRISLREGKGKTIRHKLKTRAVKVTVYGPDGTEVPSRIEIMDDGKLKVFAKADVRKGRLEVEGKRPKSNFDFSLLGEGLIRIAMGLRSVSASYSQTNGTFLPGYLPTTAILGNTINGGTLAPGAPFALGWQDENFAWKAVRNNWLTVDSAMVDAFKLTHSTSYSYRVTIEPFPFARLDITGTRTLSRNTLEYYRQGEEGYFHAVNPNIQGSFSLTTILIGTAFQSSNSDNNYVSSVFQRFADNRIVVARRLAESRARKGQYNMYELQEDGFPSGYGPQSQDVLIPSLLAAYSGRDPQRISLKLFPVIPLPNWQFTYDGLSRIKAIQPVIRQLSLRHGYRANYNIGGYQSSEQYYEEGDGFSYVRQELLDGVPGQGDFVPKYVIGNVSLTEQFSPLFGVDMTFVNTLNTKFEVRKSRTLNMSFTNNQMTDMDSWEYVVGGGYRFENLPVLLKTQLGGRKSVKSELRLQADFGIRNTSTVLRKLKEGSNTPTAGQRSYSIKLSADYMFSEQVTIRAFIDRMVNKPLVSLAFPTATTSFGISLRFTLEQ